MLTIEVPVADGQEGDLALREQVQHLSVGVLDSAQVPLEAAYCQRSRDMSSHLEKGTGHP
jgi:hypothetical protein